MSDVRLDVRHSAGDGDIKAAAQHIQTFVRIAAHNPKMRIQICGPQPGQHLVCKPQHAIHIRPEIHLAGEHQVHASVLK